MQNIPFMNVGHCQVSQVSYKKSGEFLEVQVKIKESRFQKSESLRVICCKHSVKPHV